MNEIKSEIKPETVENLKFSYQDKENDLHLEFSLPANNRERMTAFSTMLQQAKGELDDEIAKLS